MKIRGYVKYVFYPKAGQDRQKLIQFTGFCIQTREHGQVSCYGKIFHIGPSDYLELEGDFEDAGHRKFQVSVGLRVDDDELGATSMIVWLFGKKTGPKILTAFDGNAMKSLDCFKNHPDLFLSQTSKIKGVGKKTVEKAFRKWEEHVGIDVIFSQFESCGLNLSQALKIYSEWGNASLKKIEEDPYSLRECGIPFDLADRIARQRYGVSIDDPRRILAGALHTLQHVYSAGHCYIRLNSPRKNTKTPDIKSEMRRLLEIDDETIINDSLAELFSEEKLKFSRHMGKQIVYTPAMEQAETASAREIIDRLRPMHYRMEEIDKFIADFERDNFPLADLQKQAIRTSVSNQLSIISGPPGSGKTTIINTIVSMLAAFDPKANIKMCSPTGKAAQRMKESTGREASTIHRLLEYDPVSRDFVHDASNPLDCDVLIVDEFSMCGIQLFYKLICACPKSCQIIFVGDKDQLPSIEPGKVLEDMLALWFLPKTILTKVYRQKEGSAILVDALAIGSEDMEAIRHFQDAADLTFHDQTDPSILQKEIVETFLAGVQTYGPDDVCILTPMKKGELGTDIFNRIIQDRLHPLKDGQLEMTHGKLRRFRLNDRIIQIKNEPDFGVFNGDVGTIVDIEKGDRELGTRDRITVRFSDELEVDYFRDRFDRIRLAYAITVHKSQGSEYKNVLLVLHPMHEFMLKKKLVYTGWTRAKQKLDVFGPRSMIAASVRNREITRNSTFRRNVEKLYEVYHSSQDHAKRIIEKPAAASV